VERIAGYRITGVLGEGGMSIVYRAADRTGAPVAIKVLRADLAEQGRRRFLREIAAVHGLSHPSLVRVLEWGETPRGALFYAMELLEGEDLEELCARAGKLPADEVARIGRLVASGLEVAHRASLVHRDVKPANVFLVRGGAVKVLDFGLALGMQSQLASRLTSTDVLLGTPAFMSVEQATGTRDEDARTDVWGLGATLHFAISGRPPFEAPTPMGQLVRIVTDEPDPLPDDTPGFLRVAIDRALRKDRTARWPSMAAFLEALSPGGATSVGERHEAGRVSLPSPLPDEVRIVSILLADGLGEPDVFTAAVRLEGGVPHALLGGRAVGLFGGESWRGDEAVCAVRAALGVRAHDGVARLGVATGRAVLSFREDASVRTGITGAVVAAAEATAAREGVGADLETLRRIHGGFDVEGGRVIARRRGEGVVGVRGIGGADVPILGRERELRHLELALDQVVAERQAEGLLLVGPAGIGKSRLVHALRSMAATRAPEILRIEARAEAQRSLQGWHPIAGALRQRIEAPEGTPAEVLQARLLELAPTRGCAEFLGEIVGADFPASPALDSARGSPRLMRDRVVMAVGDLLESMAHARPVLLTIEDLHWADAPTVELLELLLRRLEDRPFLVVATTRQEPEAALPDFRRLPLAGISRQSTRALVEAVLGGRPDLDAVAEAIFERSGGNPYFVEELALGVRAGRRELPTSVEAAVQARLDGLTRREKDLLRRASVLGRRFWLGALVALGEPAPEEVVARLHRLELVRPEPAAPSGHDAEWRFRHAIVQEVAYASLTADQRTTLHGTAGRWLAVQGRGRAMEVARHLELGGELEAAAPVWLRAAQEAFREGDAPAALDASARALERLHDHDTAFQLRLLRTDVLHFLGRLGDSEEEIERLFATAATDAEIVEAIHRRARVLRHRGRYAAALAVLAEGLARAPQNVKLLSEDALSKAQRGRPREGLKSAEAALDAARRGADTRELGASIAIVGYCTAMHGDMGRGRALIGPATAALKEAGDPRLVAQARSIIAYGSILVGRPELALRQLRAAAEVCRTVGNWLEEAWLLPNLALVQARTGDLVHAFESLDDAMARSAHIEDPRLRILCLLRRGQVLSEAGRPAEAEPLLTEAIATDEEVQGYLAPLLQAHYAAVLLARGRGDDARHHAERALSLRDEAGGMFEGDAETFLVAHEVGIGGALARGYELLLDRAGGIVDPALRRSFLYHVPSHARTMALARAAGLCEDGGDGEGMPSG